MEGDEEIVRAESILGGRKKRAYISSPVSKQIRMKTYYEWSITQIHVTNIAIYLRGIMKLLQK